MCRCYCDLSAIDHGGIQVAGYVYGWTAGNFLGLQRAIAEASQTGECDRRGGLARSYGMEYFSGNENACRVADLIMNGSEH
jgi:hypothetical protein